MDSLWIVTKGMELICIEVEALAPWPTSWCHLCRGIGSGPLKMGSPLLRKLCGLEGITCNSAKVAEEDSKIHCDLFKQGQCKLCMQAELGIGMPTPHDKHKVQDSVIVWGREKAVKHWECTLVDWISAS